MQIDIKTMKSIWEIMKIILISGLGQRLPFMVLRIRSTVWWLSGSTWWVIIYQMFDILPQVILENCNKAKFQSSVPILFGKILN